MQSGGGPVQGWWWQAPGTPTSDTMKGAVCLGKRVRFSNPLSLFLARSLSQPQTRPGCVPPRLQHLKRVPSNFTPLCTPPPPTHTHTHYIGAGGACVTKTDKALVLAMCESPVSFNGCVSAVSNYADYLTSMQL
jgi:hypothetical protein